MTENAQQDGHCIDWEGGVKILDVASNHQERLVKEAANRAPGRCIDGKIISCGTPDS